MVSRDRFCSCRRPHTNRFTITLYKIWLFFPSFNKLAKEWDVADIFEFICRRCHIKEETLISFWPNNGWWHKVLHNLLMDWGCLIYFQHRIFFFFFFKNLINGLMVHERRIEHMWYWFVCLCLIRQDLDLDSCWSHFFLHSFLCLNFKSLVVWHSMFESFYIEKKNIR